eukprot:scaffold833_cov352-Pavlova_lutheri.AAC.8
MNSVIAPVATSSIILHKVPQRMLLSEGQRDVFVSLEENQPRIVVQRPSEGTPSSSFRTASFGLSHRFERDPLGFGSQSFPFQPRGRRIEPRGKEEGVRVCACPLRGPRRTPPLSHTRRGETRSLPRPKGGVSGIQGGVNPEDRVWEEIRRASRIFAAKHRDGRSAEPTGEGIAGEEGRGRNGCFDVQQRRRTP